MKTNKTLVKSVLMCMVAAATSFTMTACSGDQDDLLLNKEAKNMLKGGVVSKQVKGVWYACYQADGTAVSDNGDGKTLKYAHAYDVYEFNENGTGSFQRHFIGEGANTPDLSWGCEGRGNFTYTSTADGVVSITLKTDQGLPYERQWNVLYKENDANIISMGANQANITLTPANDFLTAVFNAWSGRVTATTRAAAAAGAGVSINKPGIDIIDTYGLLLRFSGERLGQAGEAYVTGLMVGDHRETVQVPAYINTGLITTSTTMMRHIVGIGYEAFKGHGHIKRLTISPDCIFFEDRCFSGCTGLVDLQINPTKLGDGAFENCTALETVNLAADCRVNKIGKDCFKGCTRLSSFQCPLTVNVIDDRAFKGCSNLRSFTFDCAHLTTIGKEAFSGCSQMMISSIPTQVETIGDEAFRYCKSIVSLIVPKGVKKIGDRAFADCSSLSSVCPASFDYSTQMGKDVYLHDDMLLHKSMPKK